MVMDDNGRSHRPSGLPKGYAGTFDGGDGGDGGGNDVTPPNPLLMLASRGMREHAARDRTLVKDAEETRLLLAAADRIEYGPEGAILLDGDGNTVYREDPAAPGLDAETMRKDPRSRAAVRAAFRSDLSGHTAAERRGIIRNANRYASPYDRRVAIDSSPNRRYLPAATIANSLRRRRDRDKADRILRELHYEDATASANVIRAGYPDDKTSAFRFINYTKIRRDGDGRPVYGEWTDRDGKKKSGIMPESRGAASRSYLRMLYQPTDGVPTATECDRMQHVFDRMDDPAVQARAFWNLCYGNANPDDRWDDVNFEIGLIGQRHTDAPGARLLEAYSNRRGGQGNAARMLAYRKCMSREAAIAFLSMDAGDPRRAHTQFTRRRRNKQTGLMEDAKPRRLTEMRSFVHAVYQIPSSEVEEYRAAHPDGPIPYGDAA